MKQTFKGEQLNFFSLLDLEKKITTQPTHIVFENDVNFPIVDFEKYRFYNLEQYENDVLQTGLQHTWRKIIHFVLNNGAVNDFLSWQNFAEMYEKGLVLQNKQSKKEAGQYYSPDDVAWLMADWFDAQSGENVCDVACGTGKLILTYLDLIGKDKAIDLIFNGKLFLYDSDEVALDICKTILLLKYGKAAEPFIHIQYGDFLSKNINLPENCKVIANPPYSTINKINYDWDITDVGLGTKELYAMFMEKILRQSKSAVIITPYSFIGGSKFYPLRKVMNNYNGFIVSFDNVPGNIFSGRKHGIFNTNTSNSVRAAITVVENKDNYKGFKTTPLIRFKNDERTKLLKTDVLQSFIDNEYQIVDKERMMYCKCAKELKAVWNIWQEVSTKCLGEYIGQNGQNIISMPNTCRYFTTASNALMHRNGQIVLTVKDKDVFNYLYCLINSSFAYWYWRMFDGGITYSKSLLLSMPVFYDQLSADDILFFRETAAEMIEKSKEYIIIKNNCGKQENIKYPKKYRDKINRRLLDILELKNIDEKVFDNIHKNSIFGVQEKDDER